MFLHCVNSIWKNVPPLSKVFGKIPTLPVPSLSLGVYHEIAKNLCIPGNYERMYVAGQFHDIAFVFRNESIILGVAE